MKVKGSVFESLYRPWSLDVSIYILIQYWERHIFWNVAIFMWIGYPAIKRALSFDNFDEHCSALLCEKHFLWSTEYSIKWFMMNNFWFSNSKLNSIWFEFPTDNSCNFSHQNICSEAISFITYICSCYPSLILLLPKPFTELICNMYSLLIYWDNFELNFPKNLCLLFS